MISDLAPHIEAVARVLLGEPNRALSSARQLRFGTRGSLAVEIAGEKVGVWHNHESGTGGGVVELVQAELGGDTAAAFRWLEDNGFKQPRDEPSSRPAIAATYDYTDENGKLLFQVVRYAPKDFRQRQPTGTGGWAWNLKGVRLVPYQLDRLMSSQAGEVFIVEGEKDADRLNKGGMLATCNPMGAGKGKFRPEFAQYFKDRNVTIIPDNDDAGRDHAAAIANILAPVARRVRLLSLPNLPLKGDVSDWLSAGNDFEDLDHLAEMAPPVRPAQVPTMEGRFRLKFFDDLAPQLASNYLVKGVLTEGGMSVVYGDSNVGKSFFVLDMAISLAMGTDWRGRRVRRGGVIYIAGEGVHGVSNRVAAFKAHHGITGPVPFAVLPTSVDLRTPHADIEDLVSLVAKAAEAMGEAVRLIVVDTLSRALAGGNENDPVDMGLYVKHIDHLREVTGAHVLSVHHTGKDLARGARGHSLLRAATDTEIEISRPEGVRISTAQVTKQRELPTDGRFPFSLEIVDLGQDEDGDAVSSCVVVAVDQGAISPPAHEKPLTAIEEMARRTLVDAIVRQGQLLPATDHYPPGLRGIKTETFWPLLEQAGVIDPEATGYRTSRKQILNSLTAKGKAGQWEGWIWSIPRP